MWPKHEKSGWRFRGTENNVTTYYASLTQGIKTEWIRPRLKHLVCRVIGHTWSGDMYYKCGVCGRNY